MVKIRLARHGGHKNAYYWVVAMDLAQKREGQYLDNLGWYKPKEKDESKKVFIDKEKLEYWRKRGALFTDSTRHLSKLISQ